MTHRLRLSCVLLCLALPGPGVAGQSPPLVEAVRDGDLDRVRSLLLQPEVDVDAAAADGTTALHWAAHLDDDATARLLLGAGTAVNAASATLAARGGGSRCGAGRPRSCGRQPRVTTTPCGRDARRAGPLMGA